MKIIRAIVLLVISISLSSCNAYKEVDIGDINKVSFKGMVDNKISFKLEVPIKNPNGYKIKIKEMDLDVSINGNYIGKMRNPSEIIIPAKSSEVHNFPVDIYVKNALASMALFYKMRNESVFEMEIVGTIKVKALLKTKSIEVSEKQSVSM